MKGPELGRGQGGEGSRVVKGPEMGRGPGW